jgi:cytochrome c peroxidase/serine/threonine protein kinase
VATGRPPGLPKEGDVVAGKYRVERILGEGGMGVVVAAEHLSLHQRVAIKFLRPESLARAEAVERFVREAQSAAAIQNEHVARIIDVGTQESGAPYIVMEHLTGRDLGDLLRERGALPAEEAVGYVLQACEAMAEAHARGIVHRDLKPSNLFLASVIGGAPVVKILDFGLAKTIPVEPAAVPEDTFTTTDVVMGSVHYMSPEQMRSLKQADLRSDIWALGVILYELVSGQRPFQGNSIPASLIMIGLDPPRPLEPGCVPPGLEAVIMRCLEKDKERRPQTISELAVLLAPFASQSALASLDRIIEYQRESHTLRGMGSGLGAANAGKASRRDPSAAGGVSAGGDSGVLRGGIAASGANQLPMGLATGARTGHADDLRDDSHDDASARRDQASHLRTAAAPPGPTRSTRPLPGEPGHDPVALAETRIDPGGTVEQTRRSKRSRRVALVSTVAAAAAAALWLWPTDEPEQGPIEPDRLASFAPLPGPPRLDSPVDRARAELGKQLFADRRLSRGGDVACTSCHPLDRFGADGRKLSRGTENREPPRNTPSIYNVATFFALLWDGRKDNLVDQAKEVLLSPRVMAASSGKQLASKVAAIPEYASGFAAAFRGERPAVTFENIARALAAYEETLVSRGRWDRFLEGDRAALTPEEKAGFNRFIEVGCVTCHFGPHIGANMFQKVGLVKAWPDSRDRGRFEITRRDADWMVFRVPTLRNVARTGPYFHDGSVSDLDTVIEMMAWHQLGKRLDEQDVRLIRVWLESLTGDPPDAK